jgi:hypothetical protein
MIEKAETEDIIKKESVKVIYNLMYDRNQS